MMSAMRAGVAVAVAAALSAAACGKKDKDPGKPGDAAAATTAAAPKPIPACDRYAAALANSDDLVAQPELHDLLRDEAALVRAANRAPTDADRAELTLRCAAGLVDLGKISTDGFDGDAGAPLVTVDAALGTGTECMAMLREFDRAASCDAIPLRVRDLQRSTQKGITDTWLSPTNPSPAGEEVCRAARVSLDDLLQQYSCP
jgi:hypothetical protein